jgi:hypothetical protein
LDNIQKVAKNQHKPINDILLFTRVCTYAVRTTQVYCSCSCSCTSWDIIVRILHFRPISSCFQLLIILCHCMYATLPGSLARQPCPAALPGSMARSSTRRRRVFAGRRLGHLAPASEGGHRRTCLTILEFFKW